MQSAPWPTLAPLKVRAQAKVEFFSREALILLFFIAASAAVLNIFMQTRSLEEGSPRFGLARMLDGSAEQPFVKRQLLPRLANQLAELIPADERAAFVEYHLDKYHLKNAYFERARRANPGQETWTDDYALMFTSLLGTLYLLRALGPFLLMSDNPLAPFLPVGFALLLPLSHLHGGFFYDFSELFFLAALLLAAFKGGHVWWIALLPLAVLNKETALLIPLLYAPLLLSNCRSGLKRVAVLFSLLLASSLFWSIGQEYAARPGGNVQWHLAGNLDFWTQAGSYFLWPDLYAPLIPVPRGFNLLLAAAFAGLLFLRWRSRPPILRQLFWAGLIVNLPLFVLFTYRDEIRNLSMLYLPTYFLATHFILSPRSQAPHPA